MNRDRTREDLPNHQHRAMTHDWSKTVKLFGKVLTCCAVCGIVRRKDKTENPCKGPTRMRPFEKKSDGARKVSQP